MSTVKPRMSRLKVWVVGPSVKKMTGSPTRRVAGRLLPGRQLGERQGLEVAEDLARRRRRVQRGDVDAAAGERSTARRACRPVAPAGIRRRWCCRRAVMTRRRCSMTRSSTTRSGGAGQLVKSSARAEAGLPVVHHAGVRELVRVRVLDAVRCLRCRRSALWCLRDVGGASDMPVEPSRRSRASHRRASHRRRRCRRPMSTPTTERDHHPRVNVVMSHATVEASHHRRSSARQPGVGRRNAFLDALRCIATPSRRTWSTSRDADPMSRFHWTSGRRLGDPQVAARVRDTRRLRPSPTLSAMRSQSRQPSLKSRRG